MPGKPDDVILFYGEAHSIVRYLIDTYGTDKFRALVAGIKDGKSIDDALLAAYGFDRDGLDARWRTSVGAVARAPTAGLSSTMVVVVGAGIAILLVIAVAGAALFVMGRRS